MRFGARERNDETAAASEKCACKPGVLPTDSTHANLDKIIGWKVHRLVIR